MEEMRQLNEARARQAVLDEQLAAQERHRRAKNHMFLQGAEDSVRGPTTVVVFLLACCLCTYTSRSWA